MKIYRLEYTQVIPVDKTECWKFFSDPKNLQKITPPDMGFEILSELPEHVYAGQIIMYKIKILPGIKIRWATEITHVKEGEYFVDEQRFGPYKFWHHQHIFTQTAKGIKATDIIHYAIPAGIIGRLMNSLIIRKKLESIFSFRKMYLENYFR